MTLERGATVMFRGLPAEVMGASKLISQGVVVRPLVPLGAHAFDYVVSAEDLATGEGAAAQHRPAPRPAAAVATEPTRKKSKRNSRDRSTAKRHETRAHRSSRRSKTKTKSSAETLYAACVAEVSIRSDLARLRKTRDKREAKSMTTRSKEVGDAETQARILRLVGVTKEQWTATAAAKRADPTAMTADDERAARRTHRKQAKQLDRMARTADATARPSLVAAAASHRRQAAGESW